MPDLPLEGAGAALRRGLPPGAPRTEEPGDTAAVFDAREKQLESRRTQLLDAAKKLGDARRQLEVLKYQDPQRYEAAVPALLAEKNRLKKEYEGLDATKAELEMARNHQEEKSTPWIRWTIAGSLTPLSTVGRVAFGSHGDVGKFITGKSVFDLGWLSGRDYEGFAGIGGSEASVKASGAESRAAAFLRSPEGGILGPTHAALIGIGAAIEDGVYALMAGSDNPDRPRALERLQAAAAGRWLNREDKLARPDSFVLGADNPAVSSGRVAGGVFDMFLNPEGLLTKAAGGLKLTKIEKATHFIFGSVDDLPIRDMSKLMFGTERATKNVKGTMDLMAAVSAGLATTTATELLLPEDMKVEDKIMLGLAAFGAGSLGKRAGVGAVKGLRGLGASGEAAKTLRLVYSGDKVVGAIPSKDAVEVLSLIQSTPATSLDGRAVQKALEAGDLRGARNALLDWQMFDTRMKLATQQAGGDPIKAMKKLLKEDAAAFKGKVDAAALEAERWTTHLVNEGRIRPESAELLKKHVAAVLTQGTPAREAATAALGEAVVAAAKPRVEDQFAAGTRVSFVVAPATKSRAAQLINGAIESVREGEDTWIYRIQPDGGKPPRLVPHELIEGEPFAASAKPAGKGRGKLGKGAAAAPEALAPAAPGPSLPAAAAAGEAAPAAGAVAPAAEKGLPRWEPGMARPGKPSAKPSFDKGYGPQSGGPPTVSEAGVTPGFADVPSDAGTPILDVPLPRPKGIKTHPLRAVLKADRPEVERIIRTRAKAIQTVLRNLLVQGGDLKDVEGLRQMKAAFAHPAENKKIAERAMQLAYDEVLAAYGQGKSAARSGEELIVGVKELPADQLALAEEGSKLLRGGELPGTPLNVARQVLDADPTQAAGFDAFMRGTREDLAGITDQGSRPLARTQSAASLSQHTATKQAMRNAGFPEELVTVLHRVGEDWAARKKVVMQFIAEGGDFATDAGKARLKQMLATGGRTPEELARMKRLQQVLTFAIDEGGIDNPAELLRRAEAKGLHFGEADVYAALEVALEPNVVPGHGAGGGEVIPRGIYDPLKGRNTGGRARKVGVRGSVSGAAAPQGGVREVRSSAPLEPAVNVPTSPEALKAAKEAEAAAQANEQASRARWEAVSKEDLKAEVQKLREVPTDRRDAAHTQQLGQLIEELRRRAEGGAADYRALLASATTLAGAVTGANMAGEGHRLEGAAYGAGAAVVGLATVATLPALIRAIGRSKGRAMATTDAIRGVLGEGIKSEKEALESIKALPEGMTANTRSLLTAMGQVNDFSDEVQVALKQQWAAKEPGAGIGINAMARTWLGNLTDYFIRGGGALTAPFGRELETAQLHYQGPGRAWVQHASNVMKVFPDESQSRIITAIEAAKGNEAKLAELLTDGGEKAGALYLKRTFDTLRNLVNQSLVARGLEPVAEVKGYFPHMFESIEKVIDHDLKVRGKPRTPEAVAEELANRFDNGVRSAYLSFKNKRGGAGGDYLRDIPRVLESYMNGALREVYFGKLADDARLLQDSGLLDKRTGEMLGKVVNLSAGFDKGSFHKAQAKFLYDSLPHAAEKVGQMLHAADPGTYRSSAEAWISIGQEVGNFWLYWSRLGLSPATAVVQYTAALSGMMETGAMPIGKAIKTLAFGSAKEKAAVEPFIQAAMPNLETMREGFLAEHEVVGAALKKFNASWGGLGWLTVADLQTRRITALAAYYDALEKGLKGQQVIDTMRDAVRRTNFFFVNGQTPAMFTQAGPLVRPALAFKTFGVRQAEMFVNRTAKMAEALRTMDGGQTRAVVGAGLGGAGGAMLGDQMEGQTGSAPGAMRVLGGLTGAAAGAGLMSPRSAFRTEALRTAQGMSAMAGVLWLMSQGDLNMADRVGLTPVEIFSALHDGAGPTKWLTDGPVPQFANDMFFGKGYDPGTEPTAAEAVERLVAPAWFNRAKGYLPGPWQNSRVSPNGQWLLSASGYNTGVEATGYRKVAHLAGFDTNAEAVQRRPAQDLRGIRQQDEGKRRVILRKISAAISGGRTDEATKLLNQAAEDGLLSPGDADTIRAQVRSRALPPMQRELERTPLRVLGKKKAQEILRGR